jgi:hypothetical protein
MENIKIMLSAYAMHLRVSYNPKENVIIFLNSNNPFVSVMKKRCFICEVENDVFKF